MRLDVSVTGEGRDVVCLHGLTATKRYVTMGSKALERGGHRVVAYDARGHGASDPAPGPSAYTYPDLVADLRRVMDEAGIERATLAGVSMGAHTVVRFALEHPERVRAACLITPAHAPDADRDLERWDALSEGLRAGGVEGFIAAYGEVPERYRDTVLTVLRQRLALHRHPEAVADALRAVPRSAPFDAWDDLRQMACPTVVVASRDEMDPGHPFAVGERYAALIPGARLLTEEPGRSPLAWQGSQISRVIAELAGSG